MFSWEILIAIQTYLEGNYDNLEKMIIFNEAEHSYVNSETGERYTSVTQLIGEFEPEFDKEYHSKRVAQKEGVPQSMVLEMWDNIAKKAQDKGTLVHGILEKYIKTGICDMRVQFIIDSYNDCVRKEIGQYTAVSSEKLLYNDEWKVAGTADLIYDMRDTFHIGDFKTNKRFRFKSQYNEYFLKPLNHLPVCEFNVYCIQLSMYAAMYENLTGKKCSGLTVFYFEDKQWKPIHLNYMKFEALRILQSRMHN